MSGLSGHASLCGCLHVLGLHIPRQLGAVIDRDAAVLDAIGRHRLVEDLDQRVIEQCRAPEEVEGIALVRRLL